MQTNMGSLKNKAKGKAGGRRLEIPPRKSNVTKSGTPLSPALRKDQKDDVEKQEDEFMNGCIPGEQH